MIILWIVTCEISTWQIFNWLSFPGNGSFGFENGANTNPFSVEPTSYDYDSPISEAGDLTDKFFKFKDVIAKYLPIPAIEVRCFIHTFENARANTSLKTRNFQIYLKFLYWHVSTAYSIKMHEKISCFNHEMLRAYWCTLINSFTSEGAFCFSNHPQKLFFHIFILT